MDQRVDRRGVVQYTPDFSSTPPKTPQPIYPFVVIHTAGSLHLLQYCLHRSVGLRQIFSYSTADRTLTKRMQNNDKEDRQKKAPR
jgi:hypothetical protein